MIKRSIQKKMMELSEKFPIISLTGPRQSGKTTLLKAMFPEYRYENLEEPDARLFAQSDPRNFLGTKERLIIDEAQRVPELFSYIQTISDRDQINGQFIVSGSQSFLLNQHISQSLAGRIGFGQISIFCRFDRRHLPYAYAPYPGLQPLLWRRRPSRSDISGFGLCPG